MLCSATVLGGPVPSVGAIAPCDSRDVGIRYGAESYFERVTRFEPLKNSSLHVAACRKPWREQRNNGCPRLLVSLPGEARRLKLDSSDPSKEEPRENALRR